MFAHSKTARFSDRSVVTIPKYKTIVKINLEPREKESFLSKGIGSVFSFASPLSDNPIKKTSPKSIVADKILAKNAA